MKKKQSRVKGLESNGRGGGVLLGAQGLLKERAFVVGGLNEVRGRLHGHLQKEQV